MVVCFRACGCQPCLKLIPFCLMTEDSLLSAGTTPRATAVKLCASGPTPAARHTRNARNPLPSFCEELTIGQNVIVRVRDDERATNPDEDYFVGKIEKKPLKLDEDGTYSAVLYKKNDWITSIRWYEFVPSKRDDSGDRFYKKGYSQWIPCGSIIRNLEKPITLKWTGKHYRLARDLHAYIEDAGDIF